MNANRGSRVVRKCIDSDALNAPLLSREKNMRYTYVTCVISSHNENKILQNVFFANLYIEEKNRNKHE